MTPVSNKNAFWSRDIKHYRKQEDGVQPIVNTEVVNEGIEAALELQRDAERVFMKKTLRSISTAQNCCISSQRSCCECFGRYFVCRSRLWYEW
jgi:hypothetical protein